MNYENFPKAKEIVNKIEGLKNEQHDLLKEGCSVQIYDSTGRYLIAIEETEDMALSILTKKYLDAVRLYYDTEIKALLVKLSKL